MSRPGPTWLFAVAFAFALDGPAGATAPPSVPGFQAESQRAHPLVGMIVRTRDGAVLDAGALVADLRHRDFILLGERHGSADHHRLQAWIIAALVSGGRRPAIGFEMLSFDQMDAVAGFLSRPDRRAADFGAAVGWSSRGWPDWGLYAPIVEVALSAGLPLFAADLPREMQRAVSRGGAGGLDSDLRARLGLDVPFDPAQARSLADELQASHCGHLSEAAVGRMMDVQRARDASFAVAMSAAAQLGGDGAVLIAGAGHVRIDRGVPWHLRRLAPERSSAALAFIEVEAGRTEAAAYGGGVFDYLWFTPRVDEKDPCEAFAEQLRRLRP